MSARLRRLILSAACLAALGGCGSVPEPPREIGGARRGEAPAPEAPRPPPPSQAKSGAVMVGAPARINVSSVCNARDEAGYAESIRVQVADGAVRELQAKIEVPKRGSCSFQLADFRQTRAAPHVELMSRSGTACAVRMWEQQGRLTVAFTDCQEKCSRDTFEYTWPIQLRAADGACG